MYTKKCAKNLVIIRTPIKKVIFLSTELNSAINLLFYKSKEKKENLKN